MTFLKGVFVGLVIMFVFCFVMMLCTSYADASPLRCESIRSPDWRNMCRAETTKDPTWCEMIKDRDVRERCRAIVQK